MTRTLIVASTVIVLFLPICAPAAADVPIPSSVLYQGTAVDQAGRPIQGTHDIEFRYLDNQGETELFSEKLSQIEFTEGRFEVELGKGVLAERGLFSSLQQVFERHPEVLMEIAIDDRIQNPWVRIAPAGHSPATITALSGPAGTDNKQLHTKGYELKSSVTGIQAVMLGPAEDNAAGPVAIDSRHFTNPMLAEQWYLGESLAVRDLEPIDATARPEVEPIEINPPRHEDIFDEDGNRYGTTTPTARDPLVTTAAPVGASPPTDLNFEGIGNVNGVLPPDTEGAVGPNHYLQVVNLSFAIYDKVGTLLQGPFNTNTLWSGFGGPCQSNNDGDAIFLYDEQADRWILSQFALFDNAVCFAVSTTADPTGSYYLFQVNTLRFPDYYKLGVWPVAANNAYFMSTNTGFQGQYDVFALDRASMLAGISPSNPQVFQNHPNLMMPADIDGTNPPPAGTPGIMYTFRDGGESYFIPPSPVDTLDLWEFDVDWTIPANSTFSNTQSFTTNDDLAEFNWTVCGFFTSNCLPQPGTAQRIDSASWWPMQRLVYRNFGSYEILLGAWTVDVTGTPDLAGLRWFELRRNLVIADPEGTAWAMHQQGTHSPDSTHRFMPSIAMDGAGNIGIGYSVTSAGIFPSIRYAVRQAGDPLGSLQTEAELMTGTGSQTHSAARWGDYSSMEVDPADDCTFWYTTEYLVTTGSAPWHTRVGTFQVPGCADGIFADGFELGTTGDWDQTVP